MNVQGCSSTIRSETAPELSSKLPLIYHILKLQNYSKVQEQDRVMHFNAGPFITNYPFK